ncbi:unannotated protein [freshwater metagenome]|uniref:Unannotated protein n=1 Tax=freshwater metagenome TaxID=449393 RepID=A0A6J6KQ10_9ZZZZ
MAIPSRALLASANISSDENSPSLHLANIFKAGAVITSSIKSTPTLSSPISHLGTYFFSLKKSSPISVANETGGITWRSLLTVSSCASTEKDHSSKTFSFIKS